MTKSRNCNTKVAFSLWLDGHCNQYLPKWLNNGCNNHLTLHQKQKVKVCGIKDICPECLGEEQEAIFCEKRLHGMASHNSYMRFLYVQAIHLSGCPHTAKSFHNILTTQIHLAYPMLKSSVLWTLTPLRCSKFPDTIVIGPSGVRALPLGCMQKCRWPLLKAFSLFSGLFAKSPRMSYPRRLQNLAWAPNSQKYLDSNQKKYSGPP